MTREAGVDVLLHSRVVGPLMEGNRVAGLLLENVSGRRALRSRMLVDATGDAVIASAAGIPYVGEEPDLRDQRQPLTLVFRMSNVDVRAFRAIPANKSAPSPWTDCAAASSRGKACPSAARPATPMPSA